MTNDKCLLTASIKVFDFSDGRKRYLDDLTVCAFDLNAWRGQSLGRFHTADDSAYALAVHRYDLNVILAIKWL